MQKIQSPLSPPKQNLLLAFTGSVATIKDLKLLTLLQATSQFNIKVLHTQNALFFTKITETEKLNFPQIEFFTEKDE